MHAVVPRLDGTPGGLRIPAPGIGQHNDEIYGRIGYSSERITSLAGGDHMSEARLRARRSSLILPVNVPRFVEKAALRGADAIVLDLEDSVPPAEKAARAASCWTRCPWPAGAERRWWCV